MFLVQHLHDNKVINLMKKILQLDILDINKQNTHDETILMNIVKYMKLRGLMLNSIELVNLYLLLRT